MMQRHTLAQCLLAIAGCCSLPACGSRTGLLPASLEGEGGAPAVMQVPECSSASECPQPPPGRCGSAACIDNRCVLDLGAVCDDGDPCTVDSCEDGSCRFSDGHVDADGDGVFARGTAADPEAPLGCGNDCDDANPGIFPGAVELCDAIDNDCNGVVDDGTRLAVTQGEPKRVSPMEASLSDASALAFDGEAFGATMTVKLGAWQGHFRRLDAQGNPLSDSQRVARVNAESYAGPLLWTGERFLTAYADARQDGNYEIYFNLLNREGQRLNEDLRVTNADDFSLRPALAWTGAEALLVWDDRRFEGGTDSSVIFSQRVAADGELLGANQRVTPAGVRGEDVSIALSDRGVGIAYVSPEGPNDDTRVKFQTATRSLEKPSNVTTIDFPNAVGPVVTAVADKYVVTFHQASAVIGPAILGVVIGPSGVELGPQSMTAGARHARGHATYSYGDRFVMVWADDESGPYQLYAQVFDEKLAPRSDRLRVTRSGSNTLGPAIAPAADGGLGVLYTDEGSGARQTFFTRLDCVERFQQ